MKLLQWKGTSGCNLPLDFWQTLKDGGKASAFHSSSWCRLLGWNSWTETIGETRLHQCSVFFLGMHHTMNLGNHTMFVPVLGGYQIVVQKWPGSQPVLLQRTGQVSLQVLSGLKPVLGSSQELAENSLCFQAGFHRESHQLSLNLIPRLDIGHLNEAENGASWELGQFSLLKKSDT